MNSPHPTPRPRSPLLPVLALTVLIGAGAAAGATAVFSSRTQTLTEEFTNKLAAGVNASGIARVEDMAYQRGFASSTQTMTVVLAPDEGTEPVRLLVTNHIQHGPFPGLRGVGQAVVDTDIRFADAQVQAQVDRAFAGKKPVIHTVVGLGGSTRTQIEVPNGSVSEDGAAVTWRPLRGQIDVDGLTTRATVAWPGLTVRGQGGQGEISGVTLGGTSRRSGPDDQLGVGQGTFTVERMSFGDGSQNMALEALKVSSESRLNGPDHYDSLVRYDLGSLTFAGKSLRNVQLHLGVRHLARAPLERLMTLLSDLQRQARTPGTSETPELTGAQTRQLEENLLALLKGGPQLTLDRLSVSQPGGDVTVTGQASLPGAASLSAGQLQMLGKMPQMLAGMLEVRLNAQADRPALRELVALFGGDAAGELEANVQSLVDAGYVQQAGNRLSTELTFRNGQPLLNGQALGQ